MTTPFKHLIPILFISTGIMLFSCGCRNTAHGFGKDVENAGEKIQKGTK